MKVEIQLHEDDPGSIKIVHTKDNLGKRSIMTITYDNSVKSSPEELQKNYEENQHRLEAITSYHKQKSHSKAKKILREHVLESLDTSTHTCSSHSLMGIKLMVETKMKH